MKVSTSIRVRPSSTFPPPIAAGVTRSVAKALALLSAREEVMVRLRFGLGRKPRELSVVAQALGLSPTAARRLQQRALQKLRTYAGTADRRPRARRIPTDRRRSRPMTKTLSSSSIGLALATLLLASPPLPAGAAGEAAPPDAVQIRLAYFPNVTHAIALVGHAKGTFAEALAPNQIDVKTFSNGPALIEALFASEVDIGYVGPNPAINGYVKSGGEALRIVAGASSGGALFVVRPESHITAARDLPGKKLATPQLGGTQDVALRHYIQQHGLKTADKGGTVQIVPTQPADILTLFREKQIDGAWVPEPWASRLVLEGKGKVFIDERAEWPEGKFTTTVVVVRKAFLDAHPDLVKQFLAAHVETTDFIAAHQEESRQLINAEIERITTKAIPAPVLAQALANTDITYDPLPQTLARQADFAFELGFLGTSKPDLSGIYATALLDQAVAQRGQKKTASR